MNYSASGNRLEREKVQCFYYVRKVVDAVAEVLYREKPDCIALSGGVDTSLLAAVATAIGVKLRAYTAVYREGIPKDLPYAEFVARKLGLELRYVLLDRGAAEYAASKVVECLGTESINTYSDGGCVEIRNDVVFYSVLQEAQRDGCLRTVVGSGGDEAFAGYGFMLKLPSSELDRAIRRMIDGRFPEVQIARCLGLVVVAPYLDPKVVEVALRIPVDCLRTTQMLGKEVLRAALEELGFYPVATRPKTPAEEGSGTKSFCRSIYDT
ncbi:MAG: asparagine synthase C-terminal domain-containing protein [Sulfolobales archaeon]|nr:asparagine synthase C-terminal domain-containing protein [Sulfolobales archaeon]